MLSTEARYTLPLGLTVFVDADGGLLPHVVGDMGVDIQRGAAGHMADDGGQRLDVHPMLQSVGGEHMSQIMEAHLLASSPL